MQILFVRNSPYLSDSIVAAVFGTMFLLFALFATFEEAGSIYLFWMFLASFTCGVTFLCAVAAILIRMYTSVRHGPGSGPGLPIDTHTTTPCDARG